jgi:hypothetical protein
VRGDIRIGRGRQKGWERKIEGLPEVDIWVGRGKTLYKGLETKI